MFVCYSAVYQDCLARITDENTLENAVIVLNPYGTAPLSAYAGVWSAEERTVTLKIQDLAQSAIQVVQDFTLNVGANLLPVLGLVADVDNQLAILVDEVVIATYTIATQPLPATDSADVQLGFPHINVTQPVTDAHMIAPGS